MGHKSKLIGDILFTTVITVVVILIIFYFHSTKFSNIIALSATKETASVAETTKVASTPEMPKKVRILIVPGHEPYYGGAEFKTLKERVLAVELGNDLKKILESDPRFEVFITRNNTAWNTTFADYFLKNWKDIIAWEKSGRKEFLSAVASGTEARPVSTIRHNTAPQNVAIRLYGIVKWSNENNIDLVIHVHFNDDAVHKKDITGKYSGFTIYVPSPEYNNGAESRKIAEFLLKTLSVDNHISTLPQESSGIINEPRLIAIGSSNMSKMPSILIEYGYIYEPKFTNINLRSSSLQNLAEETYLGLKDYFK